jgi:RNA polymerase sigma-70 factor (sigma-E family)
MNRKRDGDFEAYVNARGRALERYAYALTTDAHRAQDLVQTVLLRAYRRWDHITVLDHPDASLRRMVTNSYLDWRRRRRNSEVPTDEMPEPDGNPDLAIGVVDRDEMHRALQTLSPHQRAVLVLRYLEGLDDDSIASALGCTLGTVRSHAARGRDRVRAHLTDSALTATLPKES